MTRGPTLGDVGVTWPGGADLVHGLSGHGPDRLGAPERLSQPEPGPHPREPAFLRGGGRVPHCPGPWRSPPMILNVGSPSWRWRIAGGGPGWAASSVPIRCQAKKPLCSPRSVASAVGLRVLQPGAWQSCGRQAPPGGHAGREAEPGPVPGLQAPRVEGTPALVHTEPPHRAQSTPPSGSEACPCKVCSEEGWAPKSSFLDAKLNPGKTTARRNTNARLFYVN